MKSRLVTGILLLGFAFLAGAEPERPERPKRSDGPERDDRGRGKRDYFAHMLQKLDSDKDGSISFMEFAKGERVSELSEENQQSLFDRFDGDGDGQIRREEIPRGEGNGGPQPLHLDEDGDNRISFPEFQKNPRIVDLDEEQQRKVFDRLDRNGDGFLDKKDWRRHRPGGHGRPPHGGGMPPLAELDTDDSGTVSLEEFQKSPRMKDHPEERQKEIFERMDRNKSGELEKEELQPRQRPDRGHPPRGPREAPERPSSDAP